MLALVSVISVLFLPQAIMDNYEKIIIIVGIKGGVSIRWSWLTAPLELERLGERRCELQRWSQ